MFVKCNQVFKGSSNSWDQVLPSLDSSKIYNSTQTSTYRYTFPKNDSGQKFGPSYFQPRTGSISQTGCQWSDSLIPLYNIMVIALSFLFTSHAACRPASIFLGSMKGNYSSSFFSLTWTRESTIAILSSQQQQLTEFQVKNIVRRLFSFYTKCLALEIRIINSSQTLFILGLVRHPLPSSCEHPYYRQPTRNKQQNKWFEMPVSISSLYSVTNCTRGSHNCLPSTLKLHSRTHYSFSWLTPKIFIQFTCKLLLDTMWSKCHFNYVHFWETYI